LLPFICFHCTNASVRWVAESVVRGEILEGGVASPLFYLRILLDICCLNELKPPMTHTTNATSNSSELPMHPWRTQTALTSGWVRYVGGRRVRYSPAQVSAQLELVVMVPFGRVVTARPEPSSLGRCPWPTPHKPGSARLDSPPPQPALSPPRRHPQPGLACCV
jgi:hypothetical protein